MEESPEDASILYIDGHVRVYHGQQTQLPRHYVARQRLCLRATTDYWVNAMDGQPFFLISKAVDPGLIKVLEEEIVPQLEKLVPNQPTEQELELDPLEHRFTLVFDREGYSPSLLERMKGRRIACLTYHKHAGEAWSDEEFQVRRVELASGEVVEMALAERGTFVGKKVWVREVRKKTESGAQTFLPTNVPNQPTEQELELDPLEHRFTLVFDREGYSPSLLERMKGRRIACLTYHKHAGEAWSDEEFQVRRVELKRSGG